MKTLKGLTPEEVRGAVSDRDGSGVEVRIYDVDGVGNYPILGSYKSESGWIMKKVLGKAQWKKAANKRKHARKVKEARDHAVLLKYLAEITGG